MSSVIIGDYEYTVLDERQYFAGVKVVDKTKISYGDILSHVTIDDTLYTVKYLFTLYNVSMISGTFEGCTNLLYAPQIPDTITSMYLSFGNCTSLKIAPTIPPQVTDLRMCFENCTSLEGVININCPVPTPADWVYHMFNKVTNPITLLVPSIYQNSWAQIMKSEENIRVYGRSNNCIAVGDYYYYLNSNNTATIAAINNIQYSYGPIQGSIEVDDITYTVTDMSYCFYNCQNMIEAPKIPDTVTNLDHCFLMCTNLTTVGSLPTGATNMVSCFESCSSLVEAPEIPPNVTEMHDCFWGCTSLVEAPELPSGVVDISYCFCNCTSLITIPDLSLHTIINMEGCFSNCQSLINAPKIPCSVDNMMYCFYNCASLQGGLYVANNPTYYHNILGSTTNDICILDCCPEPSTIWENLTSQSNIFYESDLLEVKEVIGDFICNSSNYSIHVFNRNKTSYGPNLEDLQADFNFNSMEDCFKDCAQLQSVMNIPANIINMDNCFKNCTSISGTMNVPNNIQSADNIFDGTVGDIYIWHMGSSTFWQDVADEYSNVYLRVPTEGFDYEDYHYIPNNYSLSCQAINKTKTNYGSIAGTLNINGDIYTTTDLTNCFNGCTQLINTPSIPSAVVIYDNCFKDCVSLSGNIIVTNYSPVSTNSMFTGTSRNIYIIRDDTTQDATGWREAVANYTNVYFEADGNSVPRIGNITAQLGTKVGNIWTYDSNGHVLKVSVSVELFRDKLPTGWTNGFKNNADGPNIKIDNVLQEDIDWEQSNNIYTCYIYISDTNKNHTVLIEAIDKFDKQASNSTTVESVFVMLDFMPGGRGMAIGRVATHNGLTVQIPTAIGDGLKPPLIDGEVDLSNFQLIIGNYNKQDETTRNADFIIGGGTNDSTRRNSFMVRNGGLYSFNENNEPIMSINTVAKEETDASFTQQNITGNFNTTINDIILPDSSVINYRFDFTNIYKYILTQDTGAIEGKTYYSKSGDVYTPVEGLEPGDNVTGYYEREDYGNQSDQDEYTYNNLIPLTHNFDLKLNITGESLPITVGSCSTDITSNSIQLNITRQSGTDYYFTIDLYVNYRIINENFISYCFGKGLKENRQLQFLLGQYNIGNPSNILEIGNGTANDARSNAFAVNKNGRVIIGNKGAIAYEGTKATLDVIRFIDNKDDTYGHGVVIGSDGTTILGAGEYPTARMVDMGPNTEQLYLGADSNVYIETGADTFANRKTFTFTTVGDLTINRSLSTHNRTQRAGVSWIAGARGDAALIYQPRTTANDWTPVLVQRTKGGGSWQIGNYDTENLLFQYCTKANIDSQTNTVTKSIAFTPSGISGDSIARSSTSTITSIITVDSANATIVSATYNQWGKVAQLYIDWTNKKSINVPANGNITNFNVGTLVAGKRPTMNTGAWSSGDQAGAAWYNIGTGGVVNIGACEGTGTARTIAAGTHFYVYATFILP